MVKDYIENKIDLYDAEDINLISEENLFHLNFQKKFNLNKELISKNKENIELDEDYYNKKSISCFSEYAQKNIFRDSIFITPDEDKNIQIIQEFLSYSVVLTFQQDQRMYFTIQSKALYEPALIAAELFLSPKYKNKDIIINQIQSIFHNFLVKKND